MGRFDSDLIHQKLSRSEKLRRLAAKIIKLVLIFSLPVILSGLLVFATSMIYIVRPYFLTKDFSRTSCRVSGYSVHSEGSFSCSDGTDPFYPCVKVNVLYGISNATSYHESTIMENEQSLVSCSECSYTFGKHGLLHLTDDACTTWHDTYDPLDCVNDFILKNGNRDLSFPCFFNPGRPNEVVKYLVVDSNAVIHAISWPLITCMIYCLGLIFICYDAKQVKLLNKCIQAELQEQEHKAAQERTKSQLGRTLGVYRFDHSQRNIATPALAMHMECGGAVSNGRQVPQDKTDIATNSVDDDGLGDLDLRHLDLAVSSRNIEGLAAVAHSPVEEHVFTVYQNQLAYNGNLRNEDSVRFSRVKTPHQSTVLAKPMATLDYSIDHHEYDLHRNSQSTVLSQVAEV